MIFGYTLGQVSKAATSFIIFAGAVAAFFLHFNPGLVPALVVCVPALMGVINVFEAKNHTADDVQKAIEHLKAAVLVVVGFYITVPSSTDLKIGAAIAAFASFFAVKAVSNKKA